MVETLYQVNDLEEAVKYNDRLVKENKELYKEIERLNNIINELENQLQQKESVIKEVREYIEKNWISQKDADNYRFDDAELIIEISDIAVLFDILDKGKE